jgi:hypothetical protein
MKTAGEAGRTGDEAAANTERVDGPAAADAGRLRATLVVVPPGGGEAEYNLLVEVPALPREGIM